jgi:hypothetical protein
LRKSAGASARVIPLKRGKARRKKRKVKAGRRRR